MKFGNYLTGEGRQKGQQSPMATFTRGLQIPGKVWTFQFDNGYGASVINDGYGAESGLYELAVLGPDGKINYETPLTTDVLGYLDADEVGDALAKIEALTPEAIAEAKAAQEAEKRAERIAELREELAALEAEVSA